MPVSGSNTDRCVPADVSSSNCEVAFAIATRIGSAPLEAATRWAGQAGVTTRRMNISRNNWPMRQLAHKAGARLDFDEILADIAVATATSLDIAA